MCCKSWSYFIQSEFVVCKIFLEFHSNIRFVIWTKHVWMFHTTLTRDQKFNWNLVCSSHSVWFKMFVISVGVEGENRRGHYLFLRTWLWNYLPRKFGRFRRFTLRHAAAGYRRRTQFRFYPLWNFGRFQNHTRSNGLLDSISKIWAIFVNFSEFFQFMSTNFGALFSNFWNSSPLGSDLELFPSNFRDFRIYAFLPHTSRTFWVRKCCPFFVIFHVSTFWFWNNPLLELAIFRIYGYYQLTYRVH